MYAHTCPINSQLDDMMVQSHKMFTRNFDVCVFRFRKVHTAKRIDLVRMKVVSRCAHSSQKVQSSQFQIRISVHCCNWTSFSFLRLLNTRLKSMQNTVIADSDRHSFILFHFLLIQNTTDTLSICEQIQSLVALHDSAMKYEQYNNHYREREHADCKTQQKCEQSITLNGLYK